MSVEGRPLEVRSAYAFELFRRQIILYSEAVQYGCDDFLFKANAKIEHCWKSSSLLGLTLPVGSQLSPAACCQLIKGYDFAESSLLTLDFTLVGFVDCSNVTATMRLYSQRLSRMVKT